MDFALVVGVNLSDSILVKLHMIEWDLLENDAKHVEFRGHCIPYKEKPTPRRGLDSYASKLSVGM